MSKNIFVLLMAFCLMNASLAYRLPRAVDRVMRSAGNGVSSSESSEELTEKDLEELRTELAKYLPEEEVKRISDVFAKFAEGTTAEKQLEGCFELIGLLVEGALAQSKLKNTTKIIIDVVDDTTTKSSVTPTTVDLTENSV